VRGLPACKDVSAGHGHSLVLSRAGAVFAFGRGSEGQVGEGREQTRDERREQMSDERREQTRDESRREDERTSDQSR
jgi:alpha-tubulin suppressor-like RCC1 family protein